MDRSRGTPPRRRLDELLAARRPPVLPPPAVVGGWVPTMPEDSAPEDRPPDGLAPDGVAPDGLAPDGVASGGLAPDGLAPEGGSPSVPRVPERRVRPAAAAAALVLAVAVALLAWWRSAGAGQVVDVPARPERLVASSALPSSSATSPAVPAVPGGPAAGTPSRPAELLVVDVEGRVRRPGLVRLAAGSRVADAVRSAGGAAPDAVLARLNLARMLTDGEQLLVPGPGDPVPPASTAAASGAATGPGPGPTGPVDLNAAGQDALDALPGVGPVLAGRIVAWRTAHGRFTTVDELGEVEGIGPKALERLRSLVRV